MTNWFYPAGTASAGKWNVSLGADESTAKVDGWKHTGIRVGAFDAGQRLELPASAEERIVIPLSGSFTVSAVGGTYQLDGRPSVFAGPSDVFYSGTNTAITIGSDDGGRIAVASAPASNNYPERLIKAADIPVELRGAGNCSREVHNFGTPAALEADRFIVCEVLTPSGNWSSYPPHKHDEEAEGETQLEEIYYFETLVAKDSPAPSGADAMGYQRVYASDDRPIDVNAEVRTGDVVLVPYGWHGPAMATPGYDMYYLNVMAGPGPIRKWLISDDPAHGWIRQTWEDQDIDPRLPFTG